MKANELRIGNYVFNKAHERVKLKEVYSDASVYNPINLTEEWLVRFGFKLKDGIYIMHFDGNDFIGVDAEDFSVGTYVFGRIAHAPQPSIMKVHQLQNLYFALTGEELTFKNEER